MSCHSMTSNLQRSLVRCSMVLFVWASSLKVDERLTKSSQIFLRKGTKGKGYNSL